MVHATEAIGMASTNSHTSCKSTCELSGGCIGGTCGASNSARRSANEVFKWGGRRREV
jgi:hypothetical protein